MNGSEFASQMLAWVTDPTVIRVFLIVLATVAGDFITRLLLKQIADRVERSHTVWDDALFLALRLPLSLMIWVLGIGLAAEFISAETGSALGEMIDPARYVAVIAIIALFLVRFIKQCENGFIHEGADVTTTQAVGKLLRISVLITGALSVLQTLGVSIEGVLAFGGVGGIAVGFAARDLLANFFGGLMIYLDRPFAVGDWIRSPDREIEGTVEKIGWRLSIIRTFDQRPLYIPNSVFTNIAVENPSRMRNRRIYETIGVRYDDAEKVKAIVQQTRDMLQGHEAIDTERTLMVNFNKFGASSLDFFIYCFTKTTNWVEFHGIKQDVLLQIHDIIVANGAEVAFPTSTIHLAATATEPEPDHT